MKLIGIKITYYDASPDIWTKNFVVLAQSQTTNKLRNHTRMKKGFAFKIKDTLL